MCTPLIFFVFHIFIIIIGVERQEKVILLGPSEGPMNRGDMAPPIPNLTPSTNNLKT